MGYRVTSFLSISADDTQKHFLYFLPTRWLAYEWINAWMDQHFDSLASSLGPSAVLITTPSGRRAEYTEDRSMIEGLLRRSLQPSDDPHAAYSGWAVDPPWDSLHAGAPVLIASRRPLPLNSDGPVDCVAINLAAYDEHGLATLLDRFILAVQTGEDPLAVIPTAADRTNWSRYDFLKALELKPNVFGVGLNGNAVIDLVRKWRERRRETEPHERAKELPPCG
jgi:hypothetical protein